MSANDPGHSPVDKRYWVAFSLVRGIGAVRLRKLLDHFPDLQRAWHAGRAELRRAGLGDRLLENLNQVRASVDLDRVWADIDRQAITVTTWDEPDYPPRLREIDQPPPVLYLLGGLIEADRWSVAIVGTRRNTPYGRQVTELIAGDLAGRGITVISGLARGIDTLAHRAALAAGGRTLAVLGSGVDTVYPPENRRLADELVRRGALISDYPPGTLPDGLHFPARNRIIAGLALATVVVEAGEKSGALITAEFALEQGREVFAVPGSILAPQSAGSNRLIQNGARPLLAVEEVLEALALARELQYPEQPAPPALDPDEQRLLVQLEGGALHFDDLCRLTEFQADRLAGLLTMLELKGLVVDAGGKQYMKTLRLRAEG